MAHPPRPAESPRARRDLAREYFRQLDVPEVRVLGLGLPIADFDQSNWHMFQVVLPETDGSPTRAEVMESMAAEGISTGVHYPAVHLFTLYRNAGWKQGDFPHAELAGRRILTLPLFPTLSVADVERVATTLVRILKSFQPA